MAKHGGNLREAAATYGLPQAQLLDFSANINPLGPPASVLAAIAAGVSSIVHYPDPQAKELHRALAEATGYPAEQLLAGNGAAELLFAIFHALKPQRVGLLQPCFSEYEEAAKAELVTVIAREENDFQPELSELLDACGRVDLFVIASPNNPNGRVVPRAWLERMADKLAERGAFLVVDEAFLDFLPEQNSFCSPNVILMRSLTKFYSIPGLRLGYLIAAPELLGRIQSEMPPWSVNVLAQRAGIAGLQDRAFAERTLAWLAAERPELERQLRELGATVYRGEANFILFRAPLLDLVERLGKRGILIRSCADYPGLGAGYYRVAVRTREENRLLIKSLKEEWACHTR